jgi:hypothetical protein
MKQRLPFWSLPAAIGLAAMIVALSTECAYARGRGGGFPRGGFSREGPAAAGSFASRSESMLGHGRGLESTASGAANRIESGERAQAVRQHETNALQSSREQAAKALESRAQQYHRAYPYAGLVYPAWDAGAAGVAVAATGAAIGAATASSAEYAAGQPCATPAVVPVGEMTFFRCGSAWYRQAYGPAGPAFVAVGPPGL